MVGFSCIWGWLIGMSYTRPSDKQAKVKFFELLRRADNISNSCIALLQVSQ